MTGRLLLIALSATVLAWGIWTSLRNRPESPEPAAEVGSERRAMSPRLSALPDADAARLRRVREAIAASKKMGHEFLDLVVRAAPDLTDEELIAALELVSDPNYAIESPGG